MKDINRFHSSKSVFQFYGRTFLFTIWLLSCWQAEAQRSLKGIITTEGEAMIGANVYVEGTSNGAVSGIDGRFELNQLPMEEFSLILNPCCTCFDATSIPIAINVEEIKVDCNCKRGKAIVWEKIMRDGEAQWKKRKIRINLRAQF